MPDITFPLARFGFAAEIARIIREARELHGWSQRELARRAHVSQSAISRLERAVSQVVDLAAVESVLAALGIRAALQLDAVHLQDRRRQRDALHARVNGYVARRLERSGWPTIALEVAMGGDPPNGWIDQLAYRPQDRALIVEETKTDIPDMGALQRSLAFYERGAVAVARRLGWEPRRIVVVAAVLDTDVVRRRLADAPDLVAKAFPGRVGQLAAWIQDASQPPPSGWTIAGVDPASRSDRWLKPIGTEARHRPPYGGYADAASALLRGPSAR